MYYIQSISIENPVTVLFSLDSWLDPPKTQNHPCITHAFPVHPPQITAICLHPAKKNRWSHSIIHGTLSVYHQASRWDSTVPPNTTWSVKTAVGTCGISKQLQYLGVSENSGTSKSSILIGFSIINHPFWGTPIFGNTHVLNSWTHEPKKKNIAQKSCCIWKNLVHKNPSRSGPTKISRPTKNQGTKSSTPSCLQAKSSLKNPSVWQRGPAAEQPPEPLAAHGSVKMGFSKQSEAPTFLSNGSETERFP